MPTLPLLDDWAIVSTVTATALLPPSDSLPGLWGWGVGGGLDFEIRTMALSLASVPLGSSGLPYGRFQKPLEPLCNPAPTNERTFWFHHNHSLIPSGGAAPPRAVPPGSPPRNDEVYQIGLGSIRLPAHVRDRLIHDNLKLWRRAVPGTAG
jgi:hypothetical protein